MKPVCSAFNSETSISEVPRISRYAARAIWGLKSLLVSSYPVSGTGLSLGLSSMANGPLLQTFGLEVATFAPNVPLLARH